MHTKYFVVDNCTESKTIKNFGAASPHVEAAVLPDALVVESVDLSDDSGLVIAPEEGNSIFVSNFEGEKEEESLDTVFSSVYVVAHEDVVGVRWKSADFEEFEEVIELAVDVAANGDWGGDFDDVGFFAEDLLGLFA